MFNGRDTSKLSETKRAKIRNQEIGFVFQSFNLIPVLNVYENVELPLIIRTDISKKERAERTETRSARPIDRGPPTTTYAHVNRKTTRTYIKPPTPTLGTT